MGRWCWRPCGPARPAAASPSAPAPGVGTVTRPGLPIPPGEPAINPVPRRMIRDAIAEVAAAPRRGGRRRGRDRDPGRRGARDAHPQRPARHRGRAVDPRHHRHRGPVFVLVVDPFDPARHRRGARHRVWRMSRARPAPRRKRRCRSSTACPRPRSSTWAISSAACSNISARHPLPRVTIAGGVAKMTKLAQGLLDLHSKRGAVDLAALAGFAEAAGGSRRSAGAHRRVEHRRGSVRACASPTASRSATPWRAPPARWRRRWWPARPIEIEIVLFDRDGGLVGRAGFG